MIRSFNKAAFVGSLTRPPAIDYVYEFTGSEYNRFTGSVTPNVSEYTLAAWVKPSENLICTLFTRSNGSPGSSWSHSLYQSATVQWYGYTFTGSQVFTYGTSAITLGRWYHVAVTCKESGTMILYVNGTPEGTPGSIGTLWGSGNDFWIGPPTGGGGNAFRGRMCEAAIWGKELTASEVLALGTGQRRIPPTIQAAHLKLYCPMDDLTGTATGDWLELAGGNSQTRYGSVVGKADSLPRR